jgi:uncharacterized membrane protein YcaP (DUF421 family)
MELVIRAAVMYAFLWAVTRAVGRSTLGELSTFQLLLYVTMGDLVQQSITQQDYSLTGAAVVVSVFALATVGLNWTQWRFPRLRPLVNGLPVIVVRNGQLVERSLRQQKLSDDDLAAAARQQGIRDLGSLELAILEADGKISFFQREGDDAGHEGDDGDGDEGDKDGAPDTGTDS